jgi:uncharacterized protein YceH (UPF0502 family)
MLTPMNLSAVEARVLGSIVEKALTTPQQYPLTITSLVAACNQTSNRDPVVVYDEPTVMTAIGRLKEIRLVRSVLPSHGRSVVRYRHVLDETLALDQRQSALLAVLLLRGPQTIGELRIRTERMTEFDGLEALEHELEYMASLIDPLAENCGRRPGQKEERWICPLVTPAQADLYAGGPGGPGPNGLAEMEARPVAGDEPSVPADRLSALESVVTGLRSEIGELRRQLDELRASLGG